MLSKFLFKRKTVTNYLLFGNAFMIILYWIQIQPYFMIPRIPKTLSFPIQNF